jgi:hypothetical protein
MKHPVTKNSYTQPATPILILFICCQLRNVSLSAILLVVLALYAFSILNGDPVMVGAITPALITILQYHRTN